MRSPRSLSAFTLSLLVPTLGCAVGVPPASVQAGAGVRDVGNGRTTDGTTVRAGLAPLALFPSLERRRIEIVGGYEHTSGTSPDDTGIGRYTNGAYFGAGGFPVLVDHGGAVSRVGVLGQGRLLWDGRTGAQGWGTSVVLVGELASMVRAGRAVERIGDGCKPTTGVYSGAVGEGMFGLFAEGGYAQLGPLDIWSATFGVSVRLPAAGFTGIGGRAGGMCEAAR